MRAAVFGQRRLLREAPAALRAREGPLARVRARVLGQRGAARKGAAAVRARVWARGVGRRRWRLARDLRGEGGTGQPSPIGRGARDLGLRKLQPLSSPCVKQEKRGCLPREMLHITMPSVILAVLSSFHKYLVRAYNVPDSVLGTGGFNVTIKNPCFQENG